MNQIAKRSKYLSILIAIFILCGAIFMNDYIGNAKVWVIHPSNSNVYQNGELSVAGDVVSSDHVRLLTSNQDGLTYADDYTTRLSTLHVVGDKNDNITSGVLTSQKDKLIGYDFLNGVYGVKNKKHEIDLTINATLSNLAYNALGDYNGAVGIYNYKTGEVLTMVSKPSYDPYNLPDTSDEAYEGVYINRVMNGLYVPGSIMKLVTSYAAIETIPDIDTQIFHCNHGVEIDGKWIECSGNHGDQTFKEALANSCNAAFAEITLQLGKDTLSEYAKKVGILNSYDVNGVATSPGRFNVDTTSNNELAWAGIGQYTTLVNPMQYMMFCGAIANDGVMVIPHYIENNSFLSSFSQDDEQIMSTTSATKLKDLMSNNTIASYGDGNFPNLEVSAKTGTAEVEDGEPHAWFVGFSNNPDYPYAFVVIVEHGGSSTIAVDIASVVLNNISPLVSK